MGGPRRPPCGRSALWATVKEHALAVRDPEVEGLPNYDVVLRIRGYMPKDHSKLWSNWKSIREFREDKKLCLPTKMLRYLQHTRETRALKTDFIRVPIRGKGVREFKAVKLLQSLKPRDGRCHTLKDSTVRSLAKKSNRAGLDTDTLAAHWLRGASGSTLIALGVQEAVVRERGDWSADSGSAWLKHYHRKIHLPNPASHYIRFDDEHKLLRAFIDYENSRYE